MFEWLFGRKKDVEIVKDEVKNSFSSVKKDINNLSEWIKYLDQQYSKLKFDISDLRKDLSSINEDVEGLKNTLSFIDERLFKQLFKTSKQVFNKQTAVYAVQTGVQTPVQTGVYGNLSSFSITERAIILVLLNTDLKLSYDDLAAMMGKSRATIRGQINSIKQKSESLVEEVIERNGKKRVFIPDKIKEKLLKSVKVRVDKAKESAKKINKGELGEG